MGQRPIGVRVRAASGEKAEQETVVVSVGEAARSLGVSERTVFRLLKSGALERVDLPMPDRIVSFNDSNVSDMKNDKKSNRSKPDSLSGDYDDGHNVGSSDLERIASLTRQLREKDAQIAQLLQTQQDLTQTYRRLQEQMYELAHLVLSHNAASAQARGEAELKAQSQTPTASRRGLSGLLGARKRSQR